jgi:hypothetical protein
MKATYYKVFNNNLTVDQGQCFGTLEEAKEHGKTMAVNYRIDEYTQHVGEITVKPIGAFYQFIGWMPFPESGRLYFQIVNQVNRMLTHAVKHGRISEGIFTVTNIKYIHDMIHNGIITGKSPVEIVLDITNEEIELHDKTQKSLEYSKFEERVTPILEMFNDIDDLLEECDNFIIPESVNIETRIKALELRNKLLFMQTGVEIPGSINKFDVLQYVELYCAPDKVQKLNQYHSEEKCHA